MFSVPMILSAITTSRVQEDDLLVSLTSLLVKDLTLPPQRSFNVDVATDNTVFVKLVLLVFGSGPSEGVVKEFQDTTPDVSPAGKGVLQWSGKLVVLCPRSIISPWYPPDLLGLQCPPA
jgi:hypothetical protein